MIIKTINIIALSTLFAATTALAANNKVEKNQAPASTAQWALSCANQSITLSMTPDEVINKCGKPNKTRSSKDKKKAYFTYRSNNSNQNMNAQKAKKNVKNSTAAQVKLKFIDNKLVNVNYELELKDH